MKISKRGIILTLAILFFLVAGCLIAYLLFRHPSKTTPSQTDKDSNSSSQTDKNGSGIKSAIITDQNVNEKTGGVTLEKSSDGLFQTERTYESQVITANFEFNAVAPMWKELVPKGTSIAFYLQMGKGDVWSKWTKVTPYSKESNEKKYANQYPEIPIFYVGDKIQYKVILKTKNTKVSPSLKNIRFNYLDSRGKKISLGGLLGSFFLGEASAAGPSVVSRAGCGCDTFGGGCIPGLDNCDIPPKGQCIYGTPGATPPCCFECQTILGPKKIPPRKACEGFWKVGYNTMAEGGSTEGDNMEKLGKYIDDYLESKGLPMKGLRFSSINPGRGIVNLAKRYEINPFILLTIGEVATGFGMTGDPASTDCSQIFKTKPTIDNFYWTCNASDGKSYFRPPGALGQWYMTDLRLWADASQRINLTYVQNYKLRNLDDFVKAYNEKNDLNLDTGNIKEIFDKHMKYAKENNLIDCSCLQDTYWDSHCKKGGSSSTGKPGGSSNEGGGDLANPDTLSKEGIKCVLENSGHGDVLLPYVDDIYDAAHDFGVNPLLLLAIANMDSSLGSAGAGADNNNPGNIECRDTSEAGVNSGCAADGFATFDNPGDGMIAMAWLLRNGYLDEGLITPLDIANKYAPAEDGNDPEQYARNVQDFMDNASAECKDK